jgi:hypothetical protein
MNFPIRRSNMNPFLSTLILLAGLTQVSGSASGATGVENAVPVSRSTSQPALLQPPQKTTTTITTGDTLIGEPFLPDQAQDNVLVVPAPDLPAQSIADLAEDLTVMCRIFDKSAPSARTSFTYADQGNALRYVMGPQGRGTQALYLDGYGALFFIHVDYPLAPTEPQEPAQAKTTEPADSVWSQTVKEMSGQPANEPQTAPKAEAYDPQKVEALKKTLIKTLAHTSNIRMRRPQDVVTLVAGALDDNRSWGTWGQLGSRTSGRSYGTQRGQPGRGSVKGAASSASTLLVMRVTKADVDAFAKGQLTLAQFTEKVQVISSPNGQTAPAAPATPPTPIGTRR